MKLMKSGVIQISNRQCSVVIFSFDGRLFKGAKTNHNSLLIAIIIRTLNVTLLNNNLS